MMWSMLAQLQTWFGNEVWKSYGIQVGSFFSLVIAQLLLCLLLGSAITSMSSGFTLPCSKV